MAEEHRPLRVTLDPTNAMLAGESVVDQCSWCGTLVEHEAQIPLNACPACGDTKWWRQALPVGPFKAKEPTDG